VTYPDPAEHVLAARDLADAVDAVGAFEKVLTYVVKRLPDPDDAVAVELSGGADSANVLLTAAERHRDVHTVGIEVSGHAGQEQRYRRHTLAAHVGATDTVVHARDHLPFDPSARKLHEMRLLRDEQSCATTGAPLLVVSQFTLYGDTRKGRRPSWTAAARPEQAEQLVESVIAQLRERGATVAEGRFGAMMAVHSVNDGPFTVLIEV
jgi:D-Tyr-tRNAtyr deacylase